MFLDLLIDLILILILLFGSYFGYTRGLFRLAAKPLRLVTCLWISSSFCQSIGEGILFPLVKQPFSNILKSLIFEQPDVSSSQLTEEIPTVIKISAAIFDLDIDYSALSPSEIADEITGALIDPTVKMLSIIIAFIILMIISRLMIDLLINTVDSILSIGIVGSINRAGGVILSCVFAFRIAWIFAGAVDLVVQSRLCGSDNVADFSGGWIYRFFISISPIRLLLSF